LTWSERQVQFARRKPRPKAPLHGGGQSGGSPFSRILPVARASLKRNKVKKCA
jgi:hypothetical protein